MDVVCGRCRAEYEFDDALISERGTTVRCTNCGLQFKVFPQAGQRAPEVWRVFDPKNLTVPAGEYESLARLQKAISSGQVKSTHLLSRGEEEPRPLGEIVELQPLLRQPKSQFPPALEDPEQSEGQTGREVSPDPIPMPDLGEVRGRTVVGIAQRPDPSSVAATPPPRAHSMQETEPDDSEVIVPSQPPEMLSPEEASPRLPASESRRPAEANRPKIRSALSVPPSSGQSGARQESTGSGSIAPRSSLRDTLSGAPQAGENASQEEPRVPRVAPLPEIKEEAIAEPSQAVSSEPRITDSGDSFSGQMTPTPTGMRAYQSADASPVSAHAARPARRGARSALLVALVVLSAGGFMVFANRDKIQSILSPEEQLVPAPSQVVSEDLKKEFEELEVNWLKKNLFEQEGVALPDTERLLAALGTAKKESSWQMVNLLRAEGKTAEARAMTASLKPGDETAFSLAMLDYAEELDSPPWPLILERLKEASAGERGLYLARTGYIFGLAESGQLTRAQADFETLSALSGAKEAPLFEALKSYLEAREEEGVDAPEPTAPVEEPRDEDASEDETAEANAGEDGEAQLAPEPAPAEPAPEPAPQEKAKPKAKPKISAATKAEVERADAMWRGGNRDGALVIYRKVVQEIGTSHYLGVRAASRIRLSEREKAAQ